MSWEALYDDRIEDAAMRSLRSPAPQPPTSFATWSAVAATGKGFPAGGFDIVGSGLGALSAGVRAVQDAFLMDRDDPANSLSQVAGALDQRADLARGASHGFAPPETAHQADQILFNLARIGSKAAVAMGTGGAVGGGALLAAEEGATEFDRLTKRGIDPATARKSAAVMGAATGLSVGLPVAGTTVKGTIGLVAAGGPGTYMAQEKLSQQILAKAGYHDEASLHNPTDPLGLALSTILPGLFGAASLAMRPKAPALVDVVKHLESRGKRYGKDGEILTSPKGAQGEMQVMPATSRDPGFGVTPARDDSPDELARVGRDYIAAMEARYPGDPAKALAAYNAGPGAVDKAVAKAGAEWRTLMPDETRGYVAHGMNKLRDDAKAHVAMDPEVVDAARTRVTNDALNRSMPDHMDARAEVMRASDEIAAGRMPEVREMPTTALPEFREWFAASKVVDDAGEPMVVYHGGAKNFDEFDMARVGEKQKSDWGPGIYLTPSKSNADYYRVEAVKKADEEYNAAYQRYEDLTKDVKVIDGAPQYSEASRAALKEFQRIGREKDKTAEGHIHEVFANIKNPLIEPYRSMPDPFLARQAKEAGHDGIFILNGDGSINEIVAFDPKQIKAIGNSGKFDPNSASLTDPLKPGERNPRSEGRNALPPPDRVTIEPEAKPAKGEAVVSPEAARIAKLAEESPDMKVTLPGHDKPMTLAEALETAKAEAAEEAKAATLVQAALDCALSMA
jgi:hypothetical protein